MAENGNKKTHVYGMEYSVMNIIFNKDMGSRLNGVSTDGFGTIEFIGY